MTTAQHRANHYKGKHRKQSHRGKAIAAVSVATATATALTVGIAPPPPKANAAQMPVALMAAAGPNYTQDIENASDTFDNLLFARANFQNAFGSIVNPLGQASGGLLPTTGATVSQNNLLTVAGLLGALNTLLAGLTSPPAGLGNVPGLPAGAGTTLFNGLAPGLGVFGSKLGTPVNAILTNLLAVPGALTQTLASLTAINTGLTTLLSPILPSGSIPQIGIPDVTGLLDDLLASLGAQLSLTQYNSQFNWPVLGIVGASSATNLFAQIPSLSIGDLVNTLLDDLIVTVPGSSALAPVIAALTAAGLSTSLLTGLGTSVTSALGPLTGLLNSVAATPEITAWVPTASGLYTFPLGGKAGYLATMPVLDIGPVTALGVPVLTGADTVVALPIMAGGFVLPLNIASFGKLTTPGFVFPTATGVSTLGGTTLKSWTLLGVANLTSVNTLRAVYVGTNGVNINRGQTVVLLTTPFGAVPLEFSKGAVNFGTSGFGFTGPSVAGVGLLPPIQIGTAPVQTSDDGLLLKPIINAGLVIPTQATSVATLLGLPNIQTTFINPVVNPVFNATFGAAGGAVTAYLDDHVGAWVDKASNTALNLSGRLEKASEKLPDATEKPAAITTMNASLAGPASTSSAPAIARLGQAKSLSTAKPAAHVRDAGSTARHAAANVRKALGADNDE